MNINENSHRWTGFKRSLSILFLLLFLAWIIFYIRSHWAEFSALKAVSIHDLAGILLVAFLAIWIRGFFTVALAAPLGARIGRFEAFFISLLSTVGNYTLPMRGGIGLRAVYLKKKHSIGFREFAKISLARFGTIFFVDSILGLIAVFLLWRDGKVFDGPVFIVLVLALIISSIVQISGYFPLEKRLRFLKSFIGRSSSLLNLDGVRRSLILIALLNSSTRWLWILLCFQALSIDLSLSQGLMISSLIPLSMIVTLTPGNLGVTEGLLIYVSSIFDISVSSAILCSLLMRASVISWSLVMSPFLKRSLGEIRGYES
jgi:uncharacterized membrane protein YbhN (UPF0104 family)